MDKEEKLDLALYRINRAKEDIETAQLLFDNGKYRESNNRAYYSIFHAIRSILALEKKDFKRHKDVLGYFNLKYVKTEIFPRELGRKIHSASNIRDDSDYEDFFIATREEAEKQINTAKMMLELVEKYVEENKKT